MTNPSPVAALFKAVKMTIEVFAAWVTVMRRTNLHKPLVNLGQMTTGRYVFQLPQ
jgi:hypothetical protein